MDWDPATIETSFALLAGAATTLCVALMLQELRWRRSVDRRLLALEEVARVKEASEPRVEKKRIEGSFR